MSEGGGGHSCKWIVTYSDMITLLMACFIMIITFSSKEKENFAKKQDSLIGGTGGVGVAGPLKQGADSDLWRMRPPLARQTQVGSEMPPQYSDPAFQSTGELLRGLEGSALGTLADSYSLRIPLRLLFQKDTELSPSGRQLLHAVARNL